MSNPSTGRFCWHELVTSDLDAATKFYEELLGWSFRDNPSPAGGDLSDVLARRDDGGWRNGGA